MEDNAKTSAQLRVACQELGLSYTLASRLLDRLLDCPDAPAAVRSTCEAMASREAEMMRLMGTKSPDKLIHDLRNLLNEVALLKAVVDLDD